MLFIDTVPTNPDTHRVGCTESYSDWQQDRALTEYFRSLKYTETHLEQQKRGAPKQGNSWDI
jgi:hypothetical protein